MVEVPDQTKEIGKAIVVATKHEDLDALRSWAQTMLDIKGSNAPAFQKAKRAIAASADRKVLAPIMQIAWREMKRIGWEERSLPARMGAAAAALTLSGQGAGIAALGGAIGVPLFVVFGAGGALAGVIIDEIKREK